MCTSGDVQYIGEIPLVHWGMFSTLGDIMMHVGDTMSTLRDVQHIREIS